MRKTATIQDVARLAGVSTATVSRVLSSPGKVAEATRAAVLEAVRATDFRRNRQAANLRRRRTGSVIALVPNLANPFFAQILAGIASVLTPAGYGLLIADTRTDPDPDARLAHFLEVGAADGLILFDGTLSPAALAHYVPGPVSAPARRSRPANGSTWRCPRSRWTTPMARISPCAISRRSATGGSAMSWAPRATS